MLNTTGAFSVSPKLIPFNKESWGLTCMPVYVELNRNRIGKNSASWIVKTSWITQILSCLLLNMFDKSVLTLTKFIGIPGFSFIPQNSYFNLTIISLLNSTEKNSHGHLIRPWFIGNSKVNKALSLLSQILTTDCCPLWTSTMETWKTDFVWRAEKSGKPLNRW